MAIKIEMNDKGIRELLKSPEIMSACQKAGEAVAKQAGSGHRVDAFTGFDRAHVMIYANTQKAQKKTLKDNTLIKALGAVR